MILMKEIMQIVTHRKFIREYMEHFAMFAVIKSILKHYQPMVSSRKDFLHSNSSCKLSPTNVFMKIS